MAHCARAAARWCSWRSYNPKLSQDFLCTVHLLAGGPRFWSADFGEVEDGFWKRLIDVMLGWFAWFADVGGIAAGGEKSKDFRHPFQGLGDLDGVGKVSVREFDEDRGVDAPEDGGIGRAEGGFHRICLAVRQPLIQSLS